VSSTNIERVLAISDRTSVEELSSPSATSSLDSNAGSGCASAREMRIGFQEIAARGPLPVRQTHQAAEDG